ncbi:MAG: hypothetical protein EOM24_14730, partial [Chloroflexia bacterium]|nr:hypothetical protein [Chloroflexia bacterium]
MDNQGHAAGASLQVIHPQTGLPSSASYMLYYKLRWITFMPSPAKRKLCDSERAELTACPAVREKRSMMISRVEALYYRSLRYVAQDVRAFQVLVGPNASGKSTFLDVIALLGDFVRYGLDGALLFGTESGRGRASRFEELVFNQQHDYVELALEFAVPAALRQPVGEHGSSTMYDRARYEVAFGLADTGDLHIRAETLWLIEHARHPASIIATDRHPEPDLFPRERTLPASLMTTGKIPAGWQTVVRKVADGGNDYYQAEGGTWNIVYRIGPRRAALAGLPEDAVRFPITLWIRNLLLEGVRVLALNSVAMRRPASPSLSRSFSVDGANLPLVIQDLQRNHPQAYADWVAHLKTILPDLTSIS